MHHPQISVIIPTYNRAWTLNTAIDSVVAQEYPSVEIIVVDDGSTDETPQLLARYGDAIQILTLENGGVSRARNRGIDASRGDFIAFLDSDDSWLPKKLSEQMDFFAANPTALICQTEEIWIRHGKRVNPCKHHMKPSGDIFEASLHLCLVSPSAVMMKRALFERVGLFDETLPACEDYDLWLRIAYRYPIYTTASPLVVKHGGHEDQLSKTPLLDRFRIHSMVRLLREATLSPAQREATRCVLQKKGRIYAKGCLKYGRKEEAEAIIQMVVRALEEAGDTQP